MIPTLVEVKNELADSDQFDSTFFNKLCQSNSAVYYYALCCLFDEIQKGISTQSNDDCLKAKITLFHNELEKLAKNEQAGSAVSFDGVCAKLFSEENLLCSVHNPVTGEWALLSALQRCGALSLNTALLVCCSASSSPYQRIVQASKSHLHFLLQTIDSQILLPPQTIARVFLTVKKFSSLLTVKKDINIPEENLSAELIDRLLVRAVSNPLATYEYVRELELLLPRTLLSIYVNASTIKRNLKNEQEHIKMCIEKSTPHIADLIAAQGASIFQKEEYFFELASQSMPLVANKPFAEEDVAKVLIAITQQQPGVQDYYSIVKGTEKSPSFAISGTVPQQEWNETVISFCLQKLCPNADWVKVARCLDQPKLVADASGFATILDIFDWAKTKFPVDALLGKWTHPFSQRRLLLLAVQSIDARMSLAQSQSQPQPQPQKKEKESDGVTSNTTNVNPLWSSPQTYVSLMNAGAVVADCDGFGKALETAPQSVFTALRNVSQEFWENPFYTEMTTRTAQLLFKDSKLFTDFWNSSPDKFKQMLKHSFMTLRTYRNFSPNKCDCDMQTNTQIKKEYQNDFSVDVSRWLANQSSKSDECESSATCEQQNTPAETQQQKYLQRFCPESTFEENERKGQVKEESERDEENTREISSSFVELKDVCLKLLKRLFVVNRVMAAIFSSKQQYLDTESQIHSIPMEFKCFEHDCLKSLCFPHKLSDTGAESSENLFLNECQTSREETEEVEKLYNSQFDASYERRQAITELGEVLLAKIHTLNNPEAKDMGKFIGVAVQRLFNKESRPTHLLDVFHQLSRTRNKADELFVSEVAKNAPDFFFSSYCLSLRKQEQKHYNASPQGYFTQKRNVPQLASDEFSKLASREPLGFCSEASAPSSFQNSTLDIFFIRSKSFSEIYKFQEKERTKIQEQIVQVVSCIEKEMHYPSAVPPQVVREKINVLLNMFNPKEKEWMANLQNVLAQKYEDYFCGVMLMRILSDKQTPETLDSYLSVLTNYEDQTLLVCSRNYVYEAIRGFEGFDFDPSLVTVTMQIAKTFGQWLGRITLHLGFPILRKYLSFKDLILNSVRGTSMPLDHAVALICEAMTYASTNEIFTLPNPWTRGIKDFLEELYSQRLFALSPQVKSCMSIVFPDFQLRSEAKPPRFFTEETIKPQYTPEEELQKIDACIESVISEILGYYNVYWVRVARQTVQFVAANDFTAETDKPRIEKACRAMLMSCLKSFIKNECLQIMQDKVKASIKAVFSVFSFERPIYKERFSLGVKLLEDELTKYVEQGALPEILAAIEKRRAELQRKAAGEPGVEPTEEVLGIRRMMSAQLTPAQWHVYDEFESVCKMTGFSVVDAPCAKVRALVKELVRINKQFVGVAQYFISNKISMDNFPRWLLNSETLPYLEKLKSNYSAIGALTSVEDVHALAELATTLFAKYLLTQETGNEAEVFVRTNGFCAAIELVCGASDGDSSDETTARAAIRAALTAACVENIEAIMKGKQSVAWGLLASNLVCSETLDKALAALFEKAKFTVSPALLSGFCSLSSFKRKYGVESSNEARAATVFTIPDFSQMEHGKFVDMLNAFEAFSSTSPPANPIRPEWTEDEFLFAAAIAASSHFASCEGEEKHRLIRGYIDLLGLLPPAALPKALVSIAAAVRTEHDDAVPAKKQFKPLGYYALLFAIYNKYSAALSSTAKNKEEALFAFVSMFATCALLPLSPKNVCGFTFQWTELTFSRYIFPPLLGAPGRKGWGLAMVLLVSLVSFVLPVLTHQIQEVVPPIFSRLQRAVIRIILVLRHDAPDFVYANAQTLLSFAPQACRQYRALILSTTPTDALSASDVKALARPPILPLLAEDIYHDLARLVKSSSDLLLYKVKSRLYWTLYETDKWATQINFVLLAQVLNYIFSKEEKYPTEVVKLFETFVTKNVKNGIVCNSLCVLIDHACVQKDCKVLAVARQQKFKMEMVHITIERMLTYAPQPKLLMTLFAEEKTNIDNFIKLNKLNDISSTLKKILEVNAKQKV